MIRVLEVHSSLGRLCRKAAVQSVKWYPTAIQLRQDHETILVEMKIYLPTPTDVSQSITLFWNEAIRYHVELQSAGHNSSHIELVNDGSGNLRKDTDCILRSVYVRE